MDHVEKRLSDRLNPACSSISRLGSHTGHYHPQIAFENLFLAVLTKSSLSGKRIHFDKCVGIPEIAVPKCF